jgi:hypothetical protein
MGVARNWKVFLSLLILGSLSACLGGNMNWSCMNSSSSECSSTYNGINGLSYAYPFAAYQLSSPISQNYPLGNWTNYVFTISPALPVGLTLNSSTGVISGTPTATNPLAPAPNTYLVTANGPNAAVYTTTIQILAMAGFEVNNTTWGPADSCLGGSNPCNLQGMVARLATETTDTLVTIKAGTYLTSGPLNLQKAGSSTLVIVGQSPANTFIDGSNTFVGFTVGGGSNITDLGIANLEIRNMFKSGSGGSAFYASGGPTSSLTFDNCIFRGNQATHVASVWGGAISIFSIPNFVIRKSQFISNVLTSAMAASNAVMDVNNTNLSIYDSSFVSNSVSSTTMAAKGGAIGFNGAANTLYIQNTYFGSNSATTPASATGGAINVINAASTTINTSVFANNSCSAGMGGANSCQGGAIDSVSAAGTLDIDRSSFVSNLISGDSAVGSAIHATNTVVIRNSTIAFNQATGAASSAGAVYQSTNTLYLYLNTIVQNTVNIAAWSAGIHSQSNVDLGGNIVAGNFNSGGAQVLNCGGIGYTSRSYNLTDTNPSQTDCGMLQPNDRVFPYVSLSISPTLGTQKPVLALGSSSPAIDYIPYGITLGVAFTVTCGVAPHGIFDGRNFGRGTGNTSCDIGAYEYQ